MATAMENTQIDKPMENIKRWVRERAQLRRVFTRYESAVKDQLTITADELEFLQAKIIEMEKLDGKIQEEMLTSEDERYEQDCDDADNYQVRWLKVKAKFPKDSPTIIYQTASTTSKLNLPKLQVREFNDDPRNWLSFWGQFKKIHEDNNMDAETKFQYLTQAMSPGSKARTLVESFPPTEDNYKTAITTLKERFANSHILIEIYVRELLKLVTSRNNLEIDVLFYKITTNLQILESLGIAKEKYECILLPLIESALPETTLLSWSKQPRKANCSKLGTLIDYLQTEVDAERRVQLAKGELYEPSCTPPATAACLVNETQKVNERQSNKQKGKELCFFCDKAHNTHECGKANELNLEQKRQAIKKNGGCFYCLRKCHLAKACKTFIKCMQCGKRHLLMLCPSLHNETSNCTNKESKDITVTSNHLAANLSTIALQTVVVQISGGSSGKQKSVRVLLDPGSMRTYIKTQLAEELGLEIREVENLKHSLFGGVTKEAQSLRKFKFQISNLENSFITTMSALEQEIVCGNIPKLQDKKLLAQLEKRNIRLTDTDTNDLDEIGILIGSDELGTFMENNMIKLTDKLVAIKTKLGWVLQGPVPASTYSNIVHTTLITAIPEADNSLEFLWNMETLGIKDPYCQKNDTAVNINKNEDGRYEVPPLWKEGYPKIESNYEIAQRRLYSTSQKLSNTRRLDDYNEVFQNWKQEGIIEEVEPNNENDGHYLPHHAVIKMESVTTKIRPVFDAASKDKNGVSLNMCIEKGENLMEVIPKLIIMFRAGKYGVTSDIRKAFLQISVIPDDRKYLKFLWWNDPNKQDKMITYQHARVPFGVACSPFLLAATLNHHLDQHTEMFPKTSKRLKESFYVDNCVTSFNTKEEVMQFIVEATDIMNKGKFELCGWMTNSSQEEVPISVLGIQWDRNTDKLHCNLNLKIVPNNITKRNLLSVAQQIFDPIGFLSPVTLIPKLIIQKAWLLKTGWDEKISTELENEYKSWIQTIDYLQECKIPRCVSDFPLQECEASIHVFSDASKDAYSGCIFLRTEHKGQVSVRLLLAKSRVSPSKRQMTLPRLELMGSLIASRLYHEVTISGLLSSCNNCKVYCWTDSAIVLAWIHRQDTWKTFVTNRVREICINTNKDDWRHLPGINNIADLPSRGCDAKTLLRSQWWMGQKWLCLKEEDWPKSTVNYTSNDEEIINKEQCRTTVVNVEISTEDFSKRLLYFNQYNKIIRLVARLLRWSPRIRKLHNISINAKTISSEEYIYAEEVLMKLLQRENFTDKKRNKKFITTKEQGILKVKTRLEYSGETKEFINPILLPGNNEIVYRMVQDVHKKMSHAGTQTLMTTLRKTYWITGIRRVVKKIVSRCIICKRFTAKSYDVPEPPLPAERITSTAAFEVTGIDLAGTLYLKDNTKCWLVLYTCAVYRCIHLELTDTLSTNGFILTLRRFIARRGKPKVIYSDNGTNLVGTSSLLNEVNWQEIEEASNFYKIKWKFSVPAAPWWGGWWERLIRVVKDMLKRILGRASLNWIELSTILCDCESVINSRPLTYVEIGSVRPLTPMTFLQDLATSDQIPELDQIDQKSLQVRFKYIQKLREDFRMRFKTEYLSLMISKGKENRNEPKVGDLVLIDTEKNRLHWPVGIITEIFTGKDGLTRAAKVQTSSGEKVRAYQRLYPLELSSVSQEWLEMAPRPPANSMGKSTSQETGTNLFDNTDSQGTATPIPLTTATRSGRAIKLPSRFLE